MIPHIKKSVLGGTFDHFHRGHQKLLDTAFASSEHVTIGVTLPIMYQNKFLANTIEDYDTRLRNLTNYLKYKKFWEQTTIMPIEDIFGKTLEEKDIDAIFATEENLTNIALINTKRKEINFPELQVVNVPYVKDDEGENITSERIRKGEIDRKGFVYKSIFEKNQRLTLSDDLRPTLQKPLGEVVKTTQDAIQLFDEKTFIITVGDIITSELQKVGVLPAVGIIDFKTRRHELITPYPQGGSINEPGTINKKAVDAYQQALNNYFNTNKSQTVIIDGEEDLLTLPAILLGPLSAVVLYGQYDMGIVVNVVTEDLKQQISELLTHFH